MISIVQRVRFFTEFSTRDKRDAFLSTQHGRLDRCAAAYRVTLDRLFNENRREFEARLSELQRAVCAAQEAHRGERKAGGG